jgi:uncharacterized protein (TIRG00374 family)
MTSTKRGVPWHTLIILGLTIVLVWWFLRGIDLTEAWAAIVDADWRWVGLSVVVTVQTYVIRARRWQVLLAPIGPTRFRTAFRTTVIGFAANLLLPARAGEVLRPMLLARQEGLNAASAFSTVVVERLLDLVTVLLLFASAILFSGVAVPPAVENAGMVAAAAAITSLVLLAILAGHPERLGRWADRLSRYLPARARDPVGRLVRTLALGFKVMRSPAHLGLALLFSVPLWLSLAFGIVFVSWAFGLELPVVASFLVLGYLTVGVAAPTPGAAGGFHAAYKLAMTQLFGASASEAGAAAIVLHLVSFVPVALIGIVYMWQDGLTLGGVRSVKAEAEQSRTDLR